MADHPATLRVVVLQPPPADPESEFGLLAKDGVIDPGEPDGPDALRFAGEARIAEVDGGPRLRGPIVHGPLAEPFLYLACRRRAAGPAGWTFRLKVPLPRPGDPLLSSAAGPTILTARVVATRGGTVHPQAPGWARS